MNEQNQGFTSGQTTGRQTTQTNMHQRQYGNYQQNPPPGYGNQWDRTAQSQSRQDPPSRGHLRDDARAAIARIMSETNFPLGWEYTSSRACYVKPSEIGILEKFTGSPLDFHTCSEQFKNNVHLNDALAIGQKSSMLADMMEGRAKLIVNARNTGNPAEYADMLTRFQDIFGGNPDDNYLTAFRNLPEVEEGRTDTLDNLVNAVLRASAYYKTEQRPTIMSLALRKLGPSLRRVYTLNLPTEQQNFKNLGDFLLKEVDTTIKMGQATGSDDTQRQSQRNKQNVRLVNATDNENHPGTCHYGLEDETMDPSEADCGELEANLIADRQQLRKKWTW